jgi:hypothetical protein
MKYVGNCSEIINWDLVINKIKNRPGERIGNTKEIFDDNGLPNETRPDHYAQTMLLRTAGYHTGDSIEWLNYYPIKDFNQKVEKMFATFVDVKPICSWISSIRPGKCIPYHWDFDYGKKDKKISQNRDRVVRYTCHIGDPKFGHVFATDDHCFYNEDNGNTYEWDNLDVFHGGSNFGLEPKFLFNFIGMKK